MKENPLIEKSIDFAARIIKVNRYLNEDKKEYIHNESSDKVFLL